MDELSLRAAAEPVRSLKAAILIAMPDCLLFDAYVKGNDSWKLDEVAGYFGDLTRANREALKALGGWSASLQVTVETSDSLILIRELDEFFAIALMFEPNTPLGMVRLQANSLIERVRPLLPRVGSGEIPRGVRILRFLERYAPDPHAVKLRIALRSGLTLERLEAPEQLNAREVSLLEEEAKSLLGVDRLAI